MEESTCRLEWHFVGATDWCAMGLSDLCAAFSPESGDTVFANWPSAEKLLDSNDHTVGK